MDIYRRLDEWIGLKGMYLCVLFLSSLNTQDQLQFHQEKLLLEFLERDVCATLVKPTAGGEPAVDVKATRAAWAQQGMWS